ncbi:MAG: hypothetical protein R3E48_06235 [Burkholderiaceae bacterium]
MTPANPTPRPSAAATLIACLRRQAIMLPGANAEQIHQLATELESEMTAFARQSATGDRLDPGELDQLRTLMAHHAELIARARYSVERGLDALGLNPGPSAHGQPRDRFAASIAGAAAARPRVTA